MIAAANELTAVHTLIDQLSRERFYGAVTIKYEHGAIVLIRKEQNLKPSDINLRNIRGNDEYQRNS
jgi:hypothetical protein